VRRGQCSRTLCNQNVLTSSCSQRSNGRHGMEQVVIWFNSAHVKNAQSICKRYDDKKVMIEMCGTNVKRNHMFLAQSSL
jgi:hypothetical protein